MSTRTSHMTIFGSWADQAFDLIEKQRGLATVFHNGVVAFFKESNLTPSDPTVAAKLLGLWAEIEGMLLLKAQEHAGKTGTLKELAPAIYENFRQYKSRYKVGIGTHKIDPTKAETYSRFSDELNRKRVNTGGGDGTPQSGAGKDTTKATGSKSSSTTVAKLPESDKISPEARKFLNEAIARLEQLPPDKQVAACQGFSGKCYQLLGMMHPKVKAATKA